MEEYIKWLENKIEVCLEDKDLQREHLAFCQCLKKYRELALRQPPVSGRVCFSPDCFYHDKTTDTCVGDYAKCSVKQTHR